MSFLLGIGVIGTICYGIKLISEEVSKGALEMYNERKRYLDDIQKRFGSDARIREEERLRIEDRRQEEDIKRKEEDWKYDIFNPGGHQF